MGLKSRSTFYRLFEDYYSSEKTIELIENISKYIEFTEEEKRDLEARFETERVGSFYKKTRDILSRCYDEKIEGGYTVVADGEEVPLLSLMKRHCGDEAEVFIVNVDDERILGDITELLEWDEHVKVYDYIKLRSHRIRTAYELLTLIRLWKYHNYIPVLNDSPEHMGLCMVSRHDGKYFYLSVNSCGERTSFVDTEINEEMYGFIIKTNANIRSRGENLRTDVKKVSDYIDLLDKDMEFERGGLLHFSEGAPCFGRVPIDTMQDMFEDINYFGFPFEHPYVQRLIHVFRARDEYENKTPHERHMLFDTYHIEHMLRTGIAFDHLDAFRPMNAEQVRGYFERILCNEGAGAKLSFRFIRKNMIRSPFVYNSKGVLYLYSKGRDGKDSVVFIDKTGMRDIMNDFTKYIWENNTYSDEESRKMLISMMEECIDTE